MFALSWQAFFHGFLQLVLEPQRHINVNPALQLLSLVGILIMLPLKILKLLLNLSCRPCMLRHVQLLRIEAEAAFHHFFRSILDLLTQSTSVDAHAFTFHHFLWQLIAHLRNIIDTSVQAARFRDGFVQVLLHAATQVQDHFFHHRLERTRCISIRIKLFLIIFYLHYSSIQRKHLIKQRMLGLRNLRLQALACSLHVHLDL